MSLGEPELMSESLSATSHIFLAFRQTIYFSPTAVSPAGSLQAELLFCKVPLELKITPSS